MLINYTDISHLAPFIHWSNNSIFTYDVGNLKQTNANSNKTICTTYPENSSSILLQTDSAATLGSDNKTLQKVRILFNNDIH